MTYRCLVCDTRLKLHTLFGKRIDPVQCPKCLPGRYSYNFIVESDPRLWERMRHDKSFTVSDGGVLYIPGGLGLHPKREKMKNAARPV